ncbi:MAG: DUF2017 domain-containing protein [Actinobacteria bacterium]|nr:DUF2017 domain-containing protein [Actinomycetota bacterium]MCL5447351.1 DUF2017 domain-containing protein [Actinomycetota bacterium]
MEGLPRIERQRDGTYRVILEDHGRELLAALCIQAKQLIARNDPASRRLFPPAHMEGGKAEEEYRQLVGDEIRNGHIEALNILETTASKDCVSAEELEQWLDAVEILRLLLGTQLQITEDMDVDLDDESLDPRMALYHYLTWLQDHMVNAMSDSLPRSATP